MRIYCSLKTKLILLHLLQPWQARFLRGDLDYFWVSVQYTYFHVTFIPKTTNSWENCVVSTFILFILQKLTVSCFSFVVMFDIWKTLIPEIHKLKNETFNAFFVTHQPKRAPFVLNKELIFINLIHYTLPRDFSGCEIFI